jgi:hypothetical protein
MNDTALPASQSATQTTSVSKSHALVSDALQPVQMARAVRVQNGNVLLTEGPFAENEGAVGRVHPDQCP